MRCEVLDRGVLSIHGTVCQLRDTVELAIGVAVGSVLESDVAGFPASHLLSTFDWQNKCLPAFSTTKKLDTVVCDAVIDFN